MVFFQFVCNDGAQSRATPMVGWAQATTPRPPAGAGASGTTSRPDTTIGSPFIPVER